MNYSNLTWRHFEDPTCAGVLAGAGVRRGAAGGRAQGTWVQFDVRIGSQGEVSIIEAVRFLAYACPHVIAVADWVAQEAVGRPAEPALLESVHALRQRFVVPVEKLGRLLIVEDAWIAALSAPYEQTEA
jgi:NifU-like protein involved in Fe-S cluster formation